MAAATLDLIIDKGATYKKSLIYQTKDRTPIDLTGYTARMQVRKSYGGAIILDLSTSNNGITITPLEGKIEINIPYTQTEPIIENSGIYDLELISSTGDVQKFIRGSVRFPDEVTK